MTHPRWHKFLSKIIKLGLMWQKEKVKIKRINKKVVMTQDDTNYKCDLKISSKIAKTNFSSLFLGIMPL